MLMISMSVFAGDPTDVIKMNSEKVMQGVNSAKTIGEFNDYINKNIAIDNVIDFKKIAQVSLGVNWRKLNDQEKEDFIIEYKKMLYSFYVSAMFNFKNAKITYGREITEEDRSKVKTEVSYLSDGSTKKATVDYILTKNNGNWKIMDVVIEGVALTFSHKDSFTKIINESGNQALLTELREKNAKSKIKQ